MTDRTISPLRQRMIEDMTVRSFDPRTQSHYIRAVKKLTAFLGRSPDTANAEDLRRLQFHLRQTGVPALTVNATVSALRFFFRITVDRPEVVRHLAREGPMLTAEDRMEISVFSRHGSSIRAIAQRIGRSRNTVRCYLSGGDGPPAASVCLCRSGT